MSSAAPKFALTSCVFGFCLSFQLIASAQTPLIASGRPNLFPAPAAHQSLPTGLYARQGGQQPNILLASLKPGLVWQRVRPADGSVGGPVLYQLLFSTAGTPGTLAKFDTNPRHLTNSLISESGGQINFGGIVNFHANQTFPGTGKVNSITGGTFITLGGTAIDPTIDLNTGVTDLRYASLAALDAEIAARSAGDALKANLSGGNSFSGNQTISGNLTATAFFGDGSALSNIPKLTGGNSFKGNSTLGSNLSLLPEGVSSASNSGFQSGGVEFVASSFSSTTGLPVDELFRWQTLPIGNNTATPGGRLNLLFASGSPLCDPTRLPPNVCQSTPVATGFWFNSDGTMNFASNQTFPITGTNGGTVTSITAGTGLGGGTITSSGTITNTGVLSFNTRNGNVVPTSGDYTFAQIGGTLTASQLPNVAFTNVTNTFTADQRFNNNILLTPPIIPIPASGTVNATLGVFIGPGGGVVGKDTTTANGVGVQGISNLSGGVGVFGTDNATTGATDGVMGFASSPGGEGVRGVNFAINGGSGVIGVYGNNIDGTPNVNATGGVGVQGFDASPSGVGVLGKVGSATGTAGLFDNEGAGCSTSPDCQVVVANANGSTRAIIDGTGDIILKGGVGFSVNNSTVSPPIVNQLTEFDTSVSGQVSVANASTDPTKGVFGVVLSTSAATGKSQVASFGGALCAFDGAFNAGNYVLKSTTVAGQCHDAGPAYPTTVQVIGRALGTNAAAGTTKIVLFPPEEREGSGGGGGVTSITAGPGLLGGTITTSGTLSLDTVFTNARYLQLAGGSMTGLINFASGQTFPGAGNGAFLPLAGGTLTGALFGTTSSFNSATNTISSLTSATAGTGVFSHATATTGSASGVFGQSDSTGGTGVFGQSAVAAGSVAGSSGNGVFGTTNGAGGVGVLGSATDQTGLDAGGMPINSDGVDGNTASPFGNGVSGFATCGPATGCPANDSTKGGTGVAGTSASPFGAGMFAFATWPPNNCLPTNVPPCDPQSGGPVGMFAQARSAQGAGVLGNATSLLAANDTTKTPPGPPVARGGAAGVLGVSRSPNGVGMVGVATWPPVGCGTTIPNCNPNIPPIGVAGVYGIVRRTAGAGVFGESDTLTASAGIFDNAAGKLNSPPTTDCITAGMTCTVFIAQANETNVLTIRGDGSVHANGTYSSSGADFAESVSVAGERRYYEAGDVLIIDGSGNRRLAKSQEAYSTLVAGIVSTKPGMLASLHNTNDAEGEKQLASEIPLAVVGIVPCKASAENGPIRRGDLLVASSTPGYAMKGTDRGRMLGAVVGKAMQPLESGKGTIEVLVTLQ